MREMCAHERFECVSVVKRIVSELTTRPTNFGVDVQIRCADCGVRFRWLGLRAGYSLDRPMTDVTQFELRAPIEPDAHETSMAASIGDLFPAERT